jgi:uncharacterized membrane protein (DUF2068 family)
VSILVGRQWWGVRCWFARVDKETGRPSTGSEGIEIQTTEDQRPVAKNTKEKRAPRTGHARGLLLIGLFKYSKVIFFTAVGAGALNLVHKNVRDVLVHIVDALRLDGENRLVRALIDKAQLVDPHKLRQAGTLSFLYAAVCLVEGTGLVLEKGWAEYFTVTLTALGLPWESYELLERFSMYKVGLLVVNLMVLLYLVWVLKKKKDEEAKGAEARVD